MYFRQKTSKTGSVLQLIESYRDQEGRPRQKVILSLGGCALEEKYWKEVSVEVENRLKGTPSLFPFDSQHETLIKQIICSLEGKNWQSKSALKDTPNNNTIEINPSNLSHHNTTELGPELVALHAWNALDMDHILSSLKFNRAQRRDAVLSVINRLIDPCSENALPQWIQTTSFSDVLQENVNHLEDSRFYRVADKLMSRQYGIEKALAKREEELFSLQRTIYLYDLSNTYFEGICSSNPKAKRGNSKEKRTDAPLISFGMVLDADGFVIHHKTFPGNTHDATTLTAMADQLNKDTSRKKPTVIVDSGIASEANLKMLKQSGYDYIVTGKRPGRLACLSQFQTLKFAPVSGRDGRDLVQIACEDQENERIIFCYSEKRAEKEKAILSRAEERFLKDIEKLQKRLAKGLLKKDGALEKVLGRLSERHSRVYRYYDVQIGLAAERKTLQLTRKDTYKESFDLAGCYRLRSSRKDLSPDEIWHLYIMLTQVETAFKTLKSHLGLRPIFHQKEDRCDSHIFITILAYHLLHWIEYSLKSRGDTRSWATIRRLLQTHAYTTVVAPDEQGKVHHFRIPGTPDAEQQKLYDMLGVQWKNLPRSHTVA